MEQQVLAMYSLKPLAAGDPITYDFSPQLELLKTSKVVESRESCSKHIIAALHVRRQQLPTHLGQFRENNWSSAVYSMSGTYSSGKEVSCQLYLMRLCFTLKLDRVHCSVDLQAGAEGTVALHPQLATPVCGWVLMKTLSLTQ